MVESETGGTSLRVENGHWVLGGGHRSERVSQDSLYGLLPLLEQDPAATTEAVARLNGPAFPWAQVVETALRSISPYWQQAAVPWLWTLGLKPTGSLKEAAAAAVESRVTSQRARQDILRWLRGLPAR
jgi:hypothetical protein